MLQVVAAILRRGEQVLICRRTARQSHPLQWEFPGGKVEPGETPAQALARELQEELGITSASGTETERYCYQYPGKTAITLIFFEVTAYAGEPCNLIFEEMRWEDPRNLPHFDFVAGDREFLRRFASERTGSH
jgi:8-oxo-dGTP diphosphatase